MESFSRFVLLSKSQATDAFGNIFAVKRVFQDPQYKNREAEISKSLQHPNLIEILDHYVSESPRSENGGHYLNLVMNFIPTDLDQIIERSKYKPNCLSSLNMKLICFQIFNGLKYLEERSICHRDLKPANVLVNEKTMEVKICDFGAAKCLNPGEKNISYICSRHYRAPELIYGATEYTCAVDIWAAGCIMAEMVKKGTLFAGGSNKEQFIEILKVLGTPKMDDFEAMNPYINKPEKYTRRSPLPLIKIFGKSSQDSSLIDLLEQIFVYNPSKRIKASEAINHSYFDSIKSHPLIKSLSK